MGRLGPRGMKLDRPALQEPHFCKNLRLGLWFRSLNFRPAAQQLAKVLQLRSQQFWLSLQDFRSSRPTPEHFERICSFNDVGCNYLNTCGVGTSVSLGHVTTSGSVQQHQNESSRFQTLESVGLSHLSLPAFFRFRDESTHGHCI